MARVDVRVKSRTDSVDLGDVSAGTVVQSAAHSEDVLAYVIGEVNTEEETRPVARIPEGTLEHLPIDFQVIVLRAKLEVER